jgi:hypothetical protein
MAADLRDGGAGKRTRAPGPLLARSPALLHITSGPATFADVTSLSSRHHRRSHQALAVAPHIEPPYICRPLGSWHRCEPVATAELLRPVS